MHAAILSPVRFALPRALIAAFCVLVASFFALASAHAEAPSAAEGEEFIREVADQAFAIIGDAELDETERRAQLKTLMDQHVAMDYIAQLVLGRHGRANPGMTPEEKTRHAEEMAEYKALFPDFIFNKLYDIIISKFNNATVDVTGSSPVRNTDLFVHTRINRPGQEAVLADWRVRNDAKGELKVIDVRAEGISLTITQRDDFASIIGTGRKGLEPLLEHMRQNVATGGEEDADVAGDEEGASDEENAGGDADDAAAGTGETNP